MHKYFPSSALILLLSIVFAANVTAGEPCLPAVVEIPAGAFIAGSDSAEREAAYRLDEAAGQVFEWTATAADPGRAIVKGGSWDDKGCGVCRPAARHGRPVGIKHILIGFRVLHEVGDAASK